MIAHEETEMTMNTQFDLVNISRFKIKTIKNGDVVKKGEYAGYVERIQLGYRGKYVYYDFYLTDGQLLTASVAR